MTQKRPLRHSATPLVLAGALLMLAACGGQPPRPADSEPTAEPTSKPSPRATRKSSVVQKRGGGYYKDDGPGEEIPDGLDDLPDAEPRAEPLHRFANRPYVVLGKAYTPKTAVEPFRQRGIGSWYGKKFHGQKTSIGEPYDMFAMTAAHPTLPLPSYVRVTNVANGRSVVVRLTDRGPFHAERVIDLSYAAAYRLDYIDNGSAQVEVEQVVPNDPTGLTYAQVAPPLKSATLSDAAPRPLPPPAPAPARSATPTAEVDALAALTQRLERQPPPEAAAAPSAESAPRSGLFLQLGAFSSADNADSFRAHLLRELDWLSEPVAIQAGGGMHRVHLGPYPNRSAAERVAGRIRQALGYTPTFVTR